MTEPKAPSAEERADAIVIVLRRSYGLPEGKQYDPRGVLFSELRAAEAAARKRAFEEVARWHEEQADEMDDRADRLSISRHDLSSPVRLAAVSHRNCAAHFRSLADPQEGE